MVTASERVGTEHLLLDESGGLAAKTIAKLEASEGTTRPAVRESLRHGHHFVVREFEEAISRGPRQVPPGA